MIDKRIYELGIDTYQPYGGIILRDTQEFIDLTDEEQLELNELLIRFFKKHCEEEKE